MVGDQAIIQRTLSLVAAKPGSRYIDFLIPGLLGMNLMSSAIWGLGYVIVEQRFPDDLRPFIHALPLTAVIDALRANMLQGGGFSEIAPQMGVLACWLFASFALALRLFRWR